MKFSTILLSAAVAVAMTSCGQKAANAEASQTDSLATALAQTSQADTAATADQGSVIVLGAGDQIIPETNPVVIDFNATWCGPCNQFSPVYHKVADEYASKAVFTSADVDVCTSLAQKYEIQSIPAVFIVYPESTGKKPVSTIGYMNEEEFKAFLDKNL